MAIKLKASKRENLQGSVTNQLREDGFIPAILYGREKEASTISVNRLELVKTLRDEGRNAIITLDIENGETVDVMLHEYQMHPIKDVILHADFYVVDLSEAMDVEVPLRLEGEAQGSKDGGILQQPLYVLQVRAKPNEIPEEITVDVSELEIGDNLTIADLPKADQYEFLDEPETGIAIVLPPEAEEEETTEEVDLSVEPEVVGADEEDGEDEE
ncbi:MAG TPA: 50S ribosomal protein L25/general stress protein Ctc [Candidatus Dormibacteraeota bacterium]|nr:50S ribosomal protein L25/general stress protein Ctc [Candidatus Dormibacteraeota bacterium]